MENSTISSRSGRRPGSPATREEILAAAREEFATRAYGAATIRNIAAGAGVDPSLVLHYFGTKRELFVAALRLPFDPGRLLEAALADGLESAGERVVRAALTAWDEAAHSSLIALLRSAMGDESVVRMLREYLQNEILGPVAARVPQPDAETRAALLAAQMVGLVVTRYIVRLEPLASMPRERVVALLGPQVQRLLEASLEAS